MTSASELSTYILCDWQMSQEWRKEGKGLFWEKKKWELQGQQGREPLRGGGRKLPKLSLTFTGRWEKSLSLPAPEHPSSASISILRKCSHPHGTTSASGALHFLDGTWRKWSARGKSVSRASEISNPYVTLFSRGDSAQVLARQATDHTTLLPTRKRFP